MISIVSFIIASTCFSFGYTEGQGEIVTLYGENASITVTSSGVTNKVDKDYRTITPLTCSNTSDKEFAKELALDWVKENIAKKEE